ncbi:MAG: hypothetical protein EAZ79_05685 [Oscillatoriales cyanobacterium]|nr:MAG: hypothetical protein EAZ79_05685 [Oscillatoriales cyanobacterium]
MVASGSIGFKGYITTRIALLTKLTIVLRVQFLLGIAAPRVLWGVGEGDGVPPRKLRFLAVVLILMLILQLNQTRYFYD